MKKIEINDGDIYYLRLITIMSICSLVRGIIELFDNIVFGLIFIVIGILPIIFEICLLLFVKEIDPEEELIKDMNKLLRKLEKYEN